MTKSQEILKAIRETIHNTVYDKRVYVCGGYVRDEIMGKESSDIDLLVDGGTITCGIEFAEWFCKQHNIYKEGSNPLIYGSYGTAKFDFMGEKIECVAPRKEVYSENSRNPIVQVCSLKEESLRRDLSINALLKNITTCEIVDGAGTGLSDIQNHIIRTPMDPDLIMNQDPLRMCRCVRFSSRYNWEIEENTYTAIKRNASRLSIISKERISDEFGKILCCDHPIKGLELLKSTGLLHEIAPEFDTLFKMTQNQYHFGTVWEHTLSVVSYTQPLFKNRLAALFHDIGKSKTRTIGSDLEVHFYNHETVGSDIAYDIMRRLKMPLDVIEDVCFTIEQHMRTKSFGDDLKKISDKAIRKLQSDLGDRLELVLDVIHADNMSHSQMATMPNQKDNILKRIDLLKEKGLDCEKIMLPVNGNDVMEITGISPGPKVKEILNMLKEQYLENPMITRDECIEIIKQN